MATLAGNPTHHGAHLMPDFSNDPVASFIVVFGGLFIIGLVIAAAIQGNGVRGVIGAACLVGSILGMAKLPQENRIYAGVFAFIGLLVLLSATRRDGGGKQP